MVGRLQQQIRGRVINCLGGREEGKGLGVLVPTREG
jgi:hypothetical protein